MRDRSALPHERVTTSLRQSLVERVIAAILTERLEKEGFARGTVKIEEPVRGADMFTLRTSAEDGSPRVTLARLLGTVERVRQHGVTAEELARVATYYMSTYERQFAERSAQTSPTYADATKVFLNTRRAAPCTVHRRSRSRRSATRRASGWARRGGCFSATLARDMLAAGGLGRLSKPDLIQHLRGIGSSVNVTPYIGQLNQGVNGTARRATRRPE